MSAQKDFDTKISEDINTDSGFISGPIDKDFDTKTSEDINTDSGFISGPIDIVSGDLGAPTDSITALGDCAAVISSDRRDYKPDPYSGINVCERFLNLDLHDDKTPTEAQTRLCGNIVQASQPRSQGHELFQQDDDGDTPLHSAAVHGCEKSVRVLTKLCPTKGFLDMPNEYRHTPLHLAVMGGYSVVARMLVVAGASITARDAWGRTPVHIATELCNIECLNALLTPLKEQLHRSSKLILNQKDYNGQMCVHIAASAGHLKTLQTLLYFGADINAREGLAGWTPLHIAARRGDVHLAEYLLKQCPRLEATTKDFGGRTPRRLARRTKAEQLFANVQTDTDSESEDDDDSDSEGESLFEKLLSSSNPVKINVA